MASTYSSTLRIELIGNGDQSGTWGDTTNLNLGTIIEDAITGVQNITFADANYTLTAFNGLPDEARNAVLVLGGTNTAPRNLIAPSVQKTYIVKNGTGATVTVKTSGGTGLAVPNGATQLMYCDGTEFYQGAPVSGLSTGTGSLVYANSPTLTGTPIAPTAANGTSTTQIATTSFVTSAVANGFPSGGIIIWSGSAASIPAGWLLCNGSNGTPDLRDRFIVGAGSTYAVGATGGSADAIVVSHTHTATSTASGGTHHHLLYASTTSGTENFGNSSLYAAGRGDFGGSFFNQNVAPTSSVADTIRSASADATPTVSTTVASSGSSGTNANLPPYYALCYIMKA